MRTSILICLILIAAAATIAAPASAHATAYSADNKFKFTYGNLDEPVYTFQKTGLDLGITDNATGRTIAGLVPASGNPTFELWLLHADHSMKLSFSEQHGKAGWYTSPYMLTLPGVYNLRIKGTLNGTAIDQTIQGKHAIEPMNTIMWPAKVGDADQLEARIKALEGKVAELEGGSGAQAGGDAPGLGGIALLAALGLGVAILRRRKVN